MKFEHLSRFDKIRLLYLLSKSKLHSLYEKETDIEVKNEILKILGYEVFL